MTKTLTTVAIVAMSGSAMAQSGLDIDRAYAAELRADAETRSSLLGQAGPNIGVDIFTQLRYTWGTRDEFDPTGGGDTFGDADTTNGFSLPRTQVRLHGGVEGTDITGHLTFDFGGAFDQGASAFNNRGVGFGGAAPFGSAAGDGDATLLDAYGVWALDDNWSFIFGQMRNPISFEANVAPEYSLGVERSVVHSFLDMGYTQGIALQYQDDTFKFIGAISDGPSNVLSVSQGANSFTNSGGESDFSFTGRLDVLFSGTWDQFEDFASFRGSNDAIRLGAGVHWSTRGDTDPGNAGAGNVGFPSLAGAITGAPTANEDIFVWTVDGSYESDGWGLFASFTSVTVDTDFAVGVVPSSLDVTFDGLVLQGNVFLSDQFEIFGRYSVLLLEDDPTFVGALGAPAVPEDQYSTLVAGLNYYLVPESHAARFSLDVVFALDDSSGIDAISRGATGIAVPDAATTGLSFGSNAVGGTASADDELAIRAQMSLLF